MTGLNITPPAWFIAFLCAALSGCGGGEGSGGTDGGGGTQGVFANRVIAYDPANSQNATEAQWPYFFQPEVTLGAPGGVLDVASLGYAMTGGYDAQQGYDPTMTAALGGTIVLGLGDADGPRCAVDGPGDDLVVYENAFRVLVDSNSGTNTEVALVAVSADNSTWHEFPVEQNTGLPLYDPARYSGYAGVIPMAEGGDRFDLADIPNLPPGFQACYVRLTDGGTMHADYGNTQSDLYRSGADIDAIEALHTVAAPGLVP